MAGMYSYKTSWSEKVRKVLFSVSFYISEGFHCTSRAKLRVLSTEFAENRVAAVQVLTQEISLLQDQGEPFWSRERKLQEGAQSRSSDVRILVKPGVSPTHPDPHLHWKLLDSSGENHRAGRVSSASLGTVLWTVELFLEGTGSRFSFMAHGRKKKAERTEDWRAPG